MKKILFLLSLSFLITTLPCCDKSNPVSSGSSSVLVPLKTGNSWVNWRWDYDSTGIVTTITIDSLWVAGDTVVDGQNYFILSDQNMNSNGTLYPHITTYLARNTMSGYEEKYDNLDLYNYNYPYKVGDSTVVISNEIVTVPAGTYNCIVYKFIAGSLLVGTKYQAFYGKAYICPNVGIIKREATIPGNRYPIYSSFLNRVNLH